MTSTQQKSSARARSGEGPWKLPKGWEWKSLDEACRVNPKRPRINRSNGSLTSFVPMSAVDESLGVITALEDKPYAEVMRGYTYFEEGDVLFAKITPCMENGKIAIARDLIDNIGFGSTEFHVLRPSPFLIPEWVHFFMRRKSFRDEAQKYFRGAVGQQRVPQDFIESTLIPIPPDKEIQRRIVARIESLLAEVKESQKLLDKMQQDVGQVMDAAIEDVFNDLDSINFGSIVESYKNGIYKKKEFYGTGYPNVRMFNIVGGLVNIERSPLLDVTEDELEQFGLQHHDILINRVNSRELVGKSGIVPRGLGPCTFESKNIRIRLKQNLAYPPFVVAALNTYKIKSQILSVQKPAIGQATINQKNLDNLEIPFISDLTKQAEIAFYLQNLRLEIDIFRKSFFNDAQRLNQLEQSILERAFRGEI